MCLDNPKKYAILILAAGASTRLGHPKQMVNFNDQTLLNHAIREAQASEVGDIFVALGSDAALIDESVEYSVRMLHISQWNKGMGSTIAESIQKIGIKSYDGVILSVCDQPYLSRKHFVCLAKSASADVFSIILSDYGQAKGPPSYFSSIYSEELLQLTGDQGAKSIVKKHKDRVGYIDFKKGNIDIDTREDLIHLQEFVKQK